MEMEKVMAKLASLEDQLLKEVLEKEFAGHKAVPQLDMSSNGSLSSGTRHHRKHKFVRRVHVLLGHHPCPRGSRNTGT